MKIKKPIKTEPVAKCHHCTTIVPSLTYHAKVLPIVPSINCALFLQKREKLEILRFLFFWLVVDPVRIAELSEIMLEAQTAEDTHRGVLPVGRNLFTPGFSDPASFLGLPDPVGIVGMRSRLLQMNRLNYNYNRFNYNWNEFK